MSFKSSFVSVLRDEAAWKRHALLRSLVVQGPASLAFPDGYVTARPFIAEEDICVEDGAAVNNLYEALLSLGVVKMESFKLEWSSGQRLCQDIHERLESRCGEVPEGPKRVTS